MAAVLTSLSFAATRPGAAGTAAAAANAGTTTAPVRLPPRAGLMEGAAGAPLPSGKTLRMTSKVLWGEGLFLRPQHFQQQDQYHELRLHESLRAVHPYAWSVNRLRVDTDALASNVLRVLEVALGFQDGELVDAPGRDALPASVDLSGLLQNQQSMTYYAALPAFKPFGGNFSPPGQVQDSARYVQDNRDTPDLYTQAAQAQLTYLKKSVRLVSEFEPRDSYTSLPLLRMRRVATGGFELDPDFMQPCLTVGSATPLVQQLRRLLDALQAKVSALYGHHREPNRNVIEYRSGDMSSFWLLHTASTAYASLTHYFHHPGLHPERLYEQLLGLAGSLMTFSKSWTLADLPAYQHGDPGPGFGKLMAIVRELLDTAFHLIRTCRKPINGMQAELEPTANFPGQSISD